MKSGESFDKDIAEKVMNLKVSDEQIPKYSTDTVQAHKVISKLQSSGWSFHIRSQITGAGGLLYRARFVRGNQRSEQVSPSLPMSICVAALALIEGKYVEFAGAVEEEDERPIEIIGITEGAGLRKIDISEEPLEELLAREIEDFELPSSNDLKFADILAEDDLKKLPKSLLNFFVDILNKNNYCISKKID